MPDVFNKAKRSQVMSLIRGHGNKDTELALIRFFREACITGWRRHQRVFGKPDFVFRKQRVVVFVDGCFWHGCRQHSTRPKTNAKFWTQKFARNIARDRLVTRTLKLEGWKVLRIWEHELKNPQKVVNRVIKATIGASLPAGRKLPMAKKKEADIQPPPRSPNLVHCGLPRSRPTASAASGLR